MTQQERIADQFDSMAALVAEDKKCQAINLDVSGWSVAQHLDHLLKAAGRICTQINLKDKKATKRKNLLGYVILSIGIIPKGRKSPRAVEGQPTSTEELFKSLQNVKSLFEKIDFSNLQLTSFDHHVFGGLNGKDWLRFMQIHNGHHLKIIDKVLGSI